MAYSDRELFARLIKCEAGGEGDNGMKAVATVIMNRMQASSGQYQREYRGDLRKVILAPGEFTCVLNKVYGKINTQTIWASNPEHEHYAIVDWALSGHKHNGVVESLWYYNPYSSNCKQIFPSTGTGYKFNRVNQHCFYYPTSLYSKT